MEREPLDALSRAGGCGTSRRGIVAALPYRHSALVSYAVPTADSYPSGAQLLLIACAPRRTWHVRPSQFLG